MNVLCNDPAFRSSPQIRFLYFGPRPSGRRGDSFLPYDYRRPFPDFVEEARLQYGLSAVFFFLPEYRVLPPGIEEAGLPTAAFVSDWNLRHGSLEKNLLRFDRVVTDRGGCGALAGLGYRNLIPWNMYGYDEDLFAGATPEPDGRPWDVLFVGNLSPTVQADRSRFLRRLANLSGTLKVRIDTRLFGKDYVEALRSAKIVFNRSIRGEANKRVFESLAAGALVFLERENREIRDFLVEGEECLLYNDANLEELLIGASRDGELIRALTARASQKRARFSSSAMLDGLAESLTASGFWGLKAQERAFAKLPEQERLFHTLANAFYAAEPAPGAAVAQSMGRLLALNPSPEIKAIFLYYLYHTLDAAHPDGRSLRIARGIFDEIRAAGPGRHPAFLNLSLIFRKIGRPGEEAEILRDWSAVLEAGSPGPEEFSGPVFAMPEEFFFPEINRLYYSRDEGRSSALRAVFQNYCLTRLGELLREKGEGDAVPGMLRRAAATKQGNPLTHALLGQSLLPREPLAALRELCLAFERSPFMMSVWPPLVEACILCGRKEEGLGYLAEIGRLRPFVEKAFGHPGPDLTGLEARCGSM